MSTYNAIRYNNPYANAGGLVLLSTQTASASASISFTSGINSTYKEYMFVFNNIHPATDDVDFQFNFSTDGGSNYNVTKTTTAFNTYHYESDAGTNLDYDTARDLAQSTNYQDISRRTGNGNDESVSGYLHLFNPSDTNFVKHFIINTNGVHTLDISFSLFIAGYANTTSAINAIDFKMPSGNIDDGTIQMFGVVS
jgi:hypothetical protein